MKKRILQMKWTKRIVLIVLLLGVAGLGKMDAQNLIVNSDFESGNTGFITDYSYTATGVVGEGHYCIDVTASGHGGGTLGGWPNIPGFGGSGKYMLVNGHGGATNPTKIVWKQTVNVTANTDYLFSCQVVNLAQSFFGYSPNPAKLRLKINGSNVGADLTIAQNNEWHEWSNTWSSGSATQATIEIYDVYTGNSGLGDDFGLDHFQLTPQATYSVNAVDDDASVCLYSTVQIDVLANDIITPSGQQAGATVQIIQNPQHGTATWNNNTRKIQYIFTDASYSGDLDQFKYRVTIPHGEMSEAWVYVTTSKLPNVGWIDPPTTICAGGPLGIPVPTVVPAQGTGQWEYSPTQNGTYSPIPDPNNIPISMNGNYVRFSATNDCGTGSSNSVQISVKDVPSIDTIQAPLAINAGGSFNLTQPTIQPNGSPIFNQGWQIAATQNGSYTPFNNNNVPYTYNGYWIRYFADNDCGVGYSNAVQITVYQDDNNIVFADANVKAICVANWDTNGDGELSYDEAAAVTYLGQVFRSTTITSFDELQYFINLTSIENYSFNGCASLASIVIPNSVTSIGVFAFSDCSSLTSIEIPNFVTSIGEWAFSWCTGVASLEIPNSVSSIGEMAFYGCNSLTSLEIPNSVTSIGEMAFYACSSLSLVISYPSTPPALGENVFYNTPNNNMSIFVYCGALEAYQLASGWSTYNLRGMCSGEVTATANPTEGGTISGTGWYEDDQICTLVATANDGYVFAYWMENGNLVSSEATYRIPVSGDRTLVALFMQEGNIVFADDNVKSICVAHWDTNLDGELSYAEAAVVANLGQVFSYNTAITSFDELQYFINLTCIGSNEFYGCFSGCTNLASIEIPNSVTSIMWAAFSGCTSLSSIEIPNSVTYIESGAFSGCSSLVQMVVESGNTEYDSRGNCNAIIETSTNELVAGCKTTVIPNTVTSIGWTAFSSCTSLTSIEIPNSVISIKNYAFSGCSSLTSIEIPNSVTSIGYYAFYDCSSLSLVILYPSTPPSLDDNVFYNTANDLTFFVPCGTLESYQLANGWSTLNLREMCAGEITATANPTEGGTVTGTGYYEGGTKCTLTATPDEGYLFLNWSKDGQVVSSDSIYSFIVAGDADFVANFAEEGDVCALTFDLFDSYGDGYTGNYLVVTDGNGISQRLTIESGSSAVYTIPILNGSRLALTWILGSWTEDCSFTVSYSNGNVIYHGENLNEGFSYEFDVDCVGMPVSTFDVMAVANPIDGGTITGTGRYEYNATCTLTAIANEGYTFTNWTENGAIVSNDAEYSFIVSEDRDLVANFVEGDLCAIIFDLFDSYGDGYTGNHLVVTDENGSQQLTVESGSSAVYTLPFLTGSHITLTWIVGSYPEDCSFTVSYSNGNVIYHGENLSSSFSYEFDVDCSFAPIENIVFADANVKAICVANWDTNGDGELSYEEAAAVTDLGQVFYYKTTITSFNELQYFTGLTSIGRQAFQGCSGLTSIVIPNTVTSLDFCAFYDCNGLTSIIIPNSVTSIGGSAFKLCSNLTSITIPNSVISIGSDAFGNCISLTAITIPNSVTSIEYHAFWRCTSLTTVTIPQSVTSMGENPFAGCSGLEHIIVDSWNTAFDSRENCNAIIETSTNELVTGCKNTTIPNSVTSIGFAAFSGCSGLTSINIPNSVISIGNFAFDNCNSLASIAMSNSLTSIGHYAFWYCSGLTSIDIPNSVTFISHGAFESCSGLATVTIPSSVTSIESNPFGDCDGLEQIVVDSGNTVYDSREDCNAIIETNTNTIISGCKNTVIPNSVTSIGFSAFYGCSGLASINIPNSVIYIDYEAFNYCDGLTSITVLAVDPPVLDDDVFYDVSKEIPVYVPYNTIGTYQTASHWCEFMNYQEICYTTISGYGESEGNYRFIASPLVENTAPTAVDNMITETAYDLYRFDQSEDAEWQNYKFPENTPNFFLANGQGYLYANAEDVNLIFKGEFNEDDTKEVDLAYDANAEFAGWNLVGNPFPVNAYANKSYYTMNEDGTAIEPNTVSSATAIPACTGVMVMAEAEGETVVFSTEAPEAATNQGCLQIALSQAVELVETPTRKQDGTSTGSGTLHDKAIVSFNAGDRLEKFVFNKENAVISIPQGGKDFAIACTDKQGEMPLNFKASKNGEYTLTIHPEAVELDYLHLIDNLTGADVDLLALRQAQGPANYTFEAKTTDYASRFRLVFSGKEADGPSSGSETFAFVNNGNIIITGADAGATLQIVDMTGRVVASCGGHTRCVPTTGMAKGVYVLRLINGDDVKTQKIVIR